MCTSGYIRVFSLIFLRASPTQVAFHQLHSALWLYVATIFGAPVLVCLALAPFGFFAGGGGGLHSFINWITDDATHNNDALQRDDDHFVALAGGGAEGNHAAVPEGMCILLYCCPNIFTHVTNEQCHCCVSGCSSG